MKKGITRRDFMKKGSYAALGTAVGFGSLLEAGAKSRVVLVRRADALDEDFTINGQVIQAMLDDAVAALFQVDDPLEAFRRIFGPDDVVGIKSNEWNYLPTPAELEQAIKKRVMDVGVEEKNVAVDDRGVKENPVFQKATALVNARPLRTHHLAGMSGCLKNLIMFANNQAEWHPNNCINLGLLLNLPMVKGKVRLHVLSLLTPQFHGRGPHHFNRRFVWAYKGLLAGTDPVAVDAVALRILTAKRKEHFGNRYQIRPRPRYIETADTKHSLGNADPAKIELVRLGWDEGILI